MVAKSLTTKEQEEVAKQQEVKLEKRRKQYQEITPKVDNLPKHWQESQYIPATFKSNN